MNFPNQATHEDEEIVKDILQNTTEAGFGPLAKEYLTDEDVRKRFDKLKKDLEYDY